MRNNIILQAESYVKKLLTQLENYPFHQFEHAIEVKETSINIAKKEGLKKEEIEMIAIAGLFHDTGFIVQYDRNEEIGAKIARKFLRDIGYNEKKIKIIERLIISTDTNYKEPKDIMEKIIKDADLDNLGRDDFQERGNKLKKEIEMIKNIEIKDEDWRKFSLKFMKEQLYFTKYQNNKRKKKKLENMKKLESLCSKHSEKR